MTRLKAEKEAVPGDLFSEAVGFRRVELDPHPQGEGRANCKK
jgi:hypothetical protein